MRFLSKFVAGTMLMVMAAGLAAKTGYVSDELRITVRRGQSTEYGVITTISSGTSVEILQTNASSGYTQIRMANGTSGWALSRFLLAEPIARVQLVTVNQQLADVRLKLGELQPLTESQARQLAELTQQRDQLASGLQQLQSETADTVAINEKNQLLVLEIESVRSANQELTEEVGLLTDDHRLRWFLYGGGVVVIGILFGLLLPKLRIQRKAWDEF
ncbi:MAG: TIGR04211 family SH3 domain-containing protein [Immundisolibacteraceae bacterium]|nr:TIGR04211 family SH3 domain-containing protein [Immundisolibacteraceae bacterium]